MSRTPYRWPRGATISHAVQVEADPDGLVSGTEPVRCVARRIASLVSPPPGDDAPEDLVLQTVFVAGTTKDPAHWTVTGAAEDSEGLTPGFYAVDFRLELAGGTVIQTPVFLIEITERVTGAAT